MPLSPEASANVVSLAVARDRGFTSEYCNERDEFTLVSPLGTRYVFGRLAESNGPRKFYVMDLRTLTTPNNEERPAFSQQYHGITTQSAITERMADEPHTVPREPNRSATCTTATAISELDISHRQPVHQDTSDAAGIRIIPSHEMTDAFRTAVYAAITSGTTFRVDHFIEQYNEIRTPTQKCINPVTDTTVRVDQSLGTGIDDGDGSHGEVRAESPQDGNTSMQRDQVGEIALFQVGDSLFATILMLPILYAFTLPLPDQSAESIECALDNARTYAATKGFHFLLYNGISMPADNQQRRYANEVERRVDLIKDQHLLQRSATLTLTVTQLITAANAHVNLLTDHVGYPGSSPTDRYRRGPPTNDNTTM
jgi:hypothetical protein